MSLGLAPRRIPEEQKRPAGERWSPSTSLVAWWSQAHLDFDLAAGADPAGDSRRAYRARRLTSMRMRRRIAGSIESIMEDADTARLRMSSEAPLQSRAVREAEPALRTLMDALAAGEPHALPG